MPKERSFRYQERSRDDVRERANNRGGNFDSIFKPQYKVYKVKDGKNLLRILPPTWDDAKHYGIDLYINYGIGADNQSYLSLSKMKNERDPLAEARRVAERSGREKLAKDLQPNQRILMWVIDRTDEDEGPQLWTAPFSLDKAIATMSMDEDTKEVLWIDDPDKGFDVRFYREGQGLKTKYPPEKIKLIGPTHLCEDEKLQDEWLEYIAKHPLQDVLNYYDYDHIKAVFDGSPPADDDDDDRPARGRSRGRDDDEDEKPARGRGRTRDDDEDEKPARSSRSRDPEPDEDEKPARSRSRAADPDDEDAPPRRSGRASSRDADDEPEARPSRTAARGRAEDDEDAPPRSGGRRERGRLSDPEDEPEEKSARSRGRAADPEDDDDEKPVRARRRTPDPEDEPEEKPARTRGRAAEPEDDDDEVPKPARGRGRAEPEDEKDTGSSIRDRLKSRRAAGSKRDDD